MACRTTLTLCLCLAWHSQAAGYHDPSRRELITMHTAHLLRPRETQIGLWRYDQGINSTLQLGTFTLPWLIGLPNVQAKNQLWATDQWAIAASAGIGWINVGTLGVLADDSDASIWVIPLQAVVTHAINHVLDVSASLSYTQAIVQGEYRSDEFQGLAAVSNFELGTNFQWTLSRTLAFVLHARFLLLQDTNASGQVSTRLDEFTTAEVHGRFNTDALNFRAWSVLPSVVFSWRHLNLRLGLGYGNYTLPVLNFVLPEQTWIPELDVYWRF